MAICELVLHAGSKAIRIGFFSYGLSSIAKESESQLHDELMGGKSRIRMTSG